MQSKGLSRVFSNTTVQKHQFFGFIAYYMLNVIKVLCELLQPYEIDITNTVNFTPYGNFVSIATVVFILQVRKLKLTKLNYFQRLVI